VYLPVKGVLKKSRFASLVVLYTLISNYRASAISDDDRISYKPKSWPNLILSTYTEVSPNFMPNALRKAVVY
jgi:hypothetical protein